MAVKQSKTKSKPKKVAKLSAPFYTKSGNKGEEVLLPKELFGQKPNPVLIAQAVRVFLSNQRKAHAKAKTRGEVNRTTKKVYKQKGTGGARHGSRRAPIYVGGGVAHGPKGIENYKLRMPEKMAKKAFVQALSDKLAGDKVAVADIEGIEAKTKALAQYLKKIKIDNPTIVYGKSESLWRAGRNIPDISLVRGDVANTYNVVAAKSLVLTKEGLEMLEKRSSKKNA